MMTTWTWIWVLAQDGPTGTPFDLSELLPVLGVSSVFIYVWLMTTKKLDAANAARIADQQAHAAQLLALTDRLAPLLFNASRTLEAMEKGAAHVAEKVATSHNEEYQGLRDEVRALAETLRKQGH